MRIIISLIFWFLLCCCGDFERKDLFTEIGSTVQAVGVKTSPGYTYGVGAAQQHVQLACDKTHEKVCTVPKTKSPTYFISSSLTGQARTDAQNAINFIDAHTNWTFTATSDPIGATLTFNALTDECLSGVGVQKYVCADLTLSGPGLAETTPIPNTFTQHTGAGIHYDQNSLFADFSDGTQRNFVRYHGMLAAIVSWMGLGVNTEGTSSPAHQFVHIPLDTVTDFSAGEYCRMNGFLPGAQFGTSTTIGIIATCPTN